MNKRKLLIIAVLIFTFAFNTFGQTQAKLEKEVSTIKNRNLNILPLNEVKEGMRGTARTVFQGSQPTEFNVEILGVVPGAVGPKQDMIVGKISGGGADRTAVFAGMSGSPVYINGKLVGSISYSFPFSKEAICGITPIEQMIQIFEKNPNSKQKADSPRAISFAELASTNWQPNFPRGAAVGNSVLAGATANSRLSGPSAMKRLAT